MKISRLVHVVAAATATLLLLSAAPAHAAEDRTSTGKARSAGTLAVTGPTFRVTISGNAGGTGFTRTGTLVLGPTVTSVTTNGINPLEVCLSSGFPAGSPQVGAIRFGSNADCFPSSGTYLDVAYVSVSGGTVHIAPDSAIGATYINNFTRSSSITACIYTPVSGQASYTFYTDGSVYGSISITGYGGAFCGYSSYTASVSGYQIA
ncbi:hypothetical protein AB0I61_26690 [Polymorphospora rubra]|uniref:hypothetical protein n=1 Tax=Polymorphospora rubra TaxID=338584 RepID=UPI0033F020A9